MDNRRGRHRSDREGVKQNTVGEIAGHAER